MNRWLITLCAAAALTAAGCNKDTATTGDDKAEGQELPVDPGTADITPAVDATPAADAAATPAGQAPAAAPDAAAAAPAAAGPQQTTPGGTKYVDEVAGTGAEAVAGKNVVVHYTGKLENGTQFDSSVGKAPFEFKLGSGMVIKGWDEGVAGMKVGGKRKLTIPSDQGYGAQDMGVIPPNSNLLFDVELLDVK